MAGHRAAILFNRIFCFFNVLTIALAISLIVGISLFQQGSKISEQKILNQMQQATIGGLTAEQIEVLKKEPDLEDIVPYKHSDSFLMDGIKFEAVYFRSHAGSHCRRWPNRWSNWRLYRPESVEETLYQGWTRFGKITGSSP